MQQAKDRAEDLRTVTDYHEQTKHHLGRSARSLGYMDWATQPDPFRSYRGAPTVLLDEVPPGDVPSLDDIYRPLTISPEPLGRAFLSQLFYDALALSAWKEFRENRWPLRCNPSSGNLHPTEGYLLCGSHSGAGDEAGLYHYSPLLHALEKRAGFPADLWQELVGDLPEGSVLLGLTSIHWRESWKYGERAYRYCQLDVGHAVAGFSYAAAAQGWQIRLLEGVGDEGLAVLLGVSHQQGPEREHPDCLMVAAPADARELVRAATSWHLRPDVLERVARLELAGNPNRLSPGHHPWPAIDEASEACRKPPDVLIETPPPTASRILPSSFEPRNQSARKLVRQRRSAVDMDGRTWLDRSAFYRMLSALLPAPEQPPLSSLPWSPAIHLVIFVHRVRDLEPGIYLLVRRSGQQDSLATALRDNFAWERPEGCPEDFPFFLLLRGDARPLAEDVSCHQAIASHGAFAVSMVSEFEQRLAQHGHWFYRRLFWEAGAIGQVLYLEAEAAGLRATGIGCFFDDVVHEFLGLIEQQRIYQVLYHLTVGGFVEDERLRTASSYFHRESALAEAGLTTSTHQSR
jgi:SagB-type dehydrogenase family enzyme